MSNLASGQYYLLTVVSWAAAARRSRPRCREVPPPFPIAAGPHYCSNGSPAQPRRRSASLLPVAPPHNLTCIESGKKLPWGPYACKVATTNGAELADATTSGAPTGRSLHVIGRRNPLHGYRWVCISCLGFRGSLLEPSADARASRTQHTRSTDIIGSPACTCSPSRMPQSVVAHFTDCPDRRVTTITSADIYLAAKDSGERGRTVRH